MRKIVNGGVEASTRKSQARFQIIQVSSWQNLGCDLNNLKTCLRFPCLSLYPIIDSFSPNTTEKLLSGMLNLLETAIGIKSHVLTVVHILWFQTQACGLMALLINKQLVSIAVSFMFYSFSVITKTCPCNKQRFFELKNLKIFS